ncbi:hypothetical protein HY632_00905 [Candidatus Uhrbacteria bacterium]|nr:hypothetical protein [Candidatus Uhrbacteria bacterium]
MEQLNPFVRRLGDPAAEDTEALALDPSDSFCLTGGYRTVAYQRTLRASPPTAYHDERAKPFPHALHAVHALWSPAGKRLAMVEHGGNVIHIFSGTDPFDRLHRIRAWTAPFAPRGCSYSADGGLLATGTMDGHIAMHARSDDPLHHEYRVLTRLNARIHALTFSPNDRFFAAASADAYVRWWHTEDRNAHTHGEYLCNKYDGVGAIAFHPTQHSVLAVGCTNGSILLLDLATGRPLDTLGTGATFGQHIQALRFSQDGDLLIAGTREGLLIYPTVPSCAIFIKSNFVRPVSALACTQDEQLLLVNSTDNYGADGYGRGYCTLYDFLRPNFGRG